MPMCKPRKEGKTTKKFWRINVCEKCLSCFSPRTADVAKCCTYIKNETLFLSRRLLFHEKYNGTDKRWHVIHY